MFFGLHAISKTKMWILWFALIWSVCPREATRLEVTMLSSLASRSPQLSNKLTRVLNLRGGAEAAPPLPQDDSSLFSSGVHRIEPGRSLER